MRIKLVCGPSLESDTLESDTLDSIPGFTLEVITKDILDPTLEATLELIPTSTDDHSV